jgi:ABC-type transport system substrate-binding protein
MMRAAINDGLMTPSYCSAWASEARAAWLRGRPLAAALGGVVAPALLYLGLKAGGAPDREFRATRPTFEVVQQPGGADAISRYHGAETPLPENGYRGANRPRYRNPEFDAMIDRFITTIPRGERGEILGRIVNHMTRYVTVLGIYWALDPTMISNRLSNVSGRNSTWNAHDWDV